MFHDITVTLTLYVIRAYNLHEAYPDCIALDKVYKKVLVCVIFQRLFGQNPQFSRPF